MLRSAAHEALLDAIKPRPDDVFVTLGDYIDRGTDSKSVLDRLTDLGHRCRLVPILGNHDQILLDVRSGDKPIDRLLDIGSMCRRDDQPLRTNTGTDKTGHSDNGRNRKE